MDKSEDCSGLMSNSNNKSGHAEKGDKRKLRPTLTLSQIKLAVALELRAEGFETVVFDRVVEFGGQRVRVHVLCEDEDGFCLAVYCVNRAELMKVERVFEVVNIMSRCGYDVAIAFPLTLLERAAEIIGMTNRVFMVDSEGRVWIHYPLLGSRIVEVFRETKEAIMDKEGDEEAPTTENQGTQLRNLSPFYIA